jgi:cephalosporin hydroxylase
MSIRNIYFIHNYVTPEHNSTLSACASHDVRPDGTYIGYSTPKRKAWLTQHTKRILHDFQWVYENNRVHQRQRFMGVRIGQDPFDAFVIQEMLWDVKPDLIIETGTNSGGGALYMATLMEYINPACKIFTIDTLPIEAWVARFKGGGRAGRQLLGSKKPKKDGAAAFGAEEAAEEEDEYDLTGLVDPRENLAWQKRVTQAVGKSTDRRILRQLKHDFVSRATKVLVVLDSDHSSGTVLSELINYAPFVTLGSYVVVEDTWQRHPLFAAEKFLAKYGAEFVQDRSREHLLWSQHKGGFLKRVQLPARSPTTGDVDFDYTVDVEVAGGRVKTYGPVDTSGGRLKLGPE